MPDKDTNPILDHSKKMWTKAHKMLHISQYKQGYSSIWNNPSIRIGKKTIQWESWLDKNIKKVSDLYRADTLRSFQELKDDFGLTDKREFWRYL